MGFKPFRENYRLLALFLAFFFGLLAFLGLIFTCVSNADCAAATIAIGIL
jgi:hypothetical protein